MTRSKRWKAPGPDATTEEIKAAVQAQMMRNRNREEKGRETGDDRRRAEEIEPLVQHFAARAAADRDRLEQPGGFEELLQCYDDDPITKAVLAGDITATEAFKLRLLAAGWPPDYLERDPNGRLRQTAVAKSTRNSS